MAKRLTMLWNDFHLPSTPRQISSFHCKPSRPSDKNRTLSIRDQRHCQRQIGKDGPDGRCFRTQQLNSHPDGTQSAMRKCLTAGPEHLTARIKRNGGERVTIVKTMIALDRHRSLKMDGVRIECNQCNGFAIFKRPHISLQLTTESNSEPRSIASALFSSRRPFGNWGDLAMTREMEDNIAFIPELISQSEESPVVNGVEPPQSDLNGLT
jgi:hypothetical protein